MQTTVKELCLNWIESPENKAQSQFLHTFLPRNFFLGGRGAGKTYALIAKDAIYCLLINKGCMSYLTERTGPEVRDILLPKIEEVVPKELVQIKKVSQTSWDLHWATGSTTRLRSRQAKNSRDEPPFRGPDAQKIGHDELAIDRDGNKMIRISEAMLRGGKGAPLVQDATTTKKMGWLYKYLDQWGLTGNENGIESKDGRTIVFQGCTKDNRHNDDLDSRLRETYSPEFAAQELDNLWTLLSGRIWKNFLEKHWPYGNLHHHRYDPTRPYILAVDLGVRSAWGIWQRIPATDEYGRRDQGQKMLDVLVAEFVPNHGNARDLVSLIDIRYGRPHHAVVGQDINTRSVGDGTKPAFFFTTKWPGIHVKTPSGFLSDKETQHWQAQAMICNAYSQRQVCISTHLDSDAEGRGIMDMLRLDAWPEGALRSGSFFEKDKSFGGVGIEDVRDMFLYYIICQYPPEFRRETRIQ